MNDLELEPYALPHHMYAVDLLGQQITGSSFS